MENLFSKYFAGYDLAYGQADMSRLEIDPITKKQKPSYRWNDEDITDQVYNDHLAGERSIGIQPCTRMDWQGLVPSMSTSRIMRSTTVKSFLIQYRSLIYH